MKKVVAGMDLHSNNVVIGIMDLDGKRVASRKVPCELKEVVKFLAPYKKRLEKIGVESTYNWYWLVDGLEAQKYPVVLANPAGMEQYNGIKHADDTNDAFFLAELLRLKILPTGHIYDARLRPVRDLLRRRLKLVQHRTALMLSFKSLYTRITGREMSLSQLKEMQIKEAQQLYTHPANQLIAGMQIKHIDFKSARASQPLRKGCWRPARQLPFYAKLLTLPGVGKILGMTLLRWKWARSNASPNLGTSPATAAQWRPSALPTTKRKGPTTQNVATSIWRGHSWKRPISPSATNEQCRKWYDPQGGQDQ